MKYVYMVQLDRSATDSDSIETELYEDYDKAYSDGNGRHIEQCYMFYSFRNALQKFRKEFGLQRKHIRLVDLYKEPLTCSTKSKK